MTRKIRLSLPGYAHHVIHLRAGEKIIFQCAADYRYYIEILTEAAQMFQCAVHAYRLLPSHIRLLSTPLAAGALGRMMQSVGQRYVQYFNKSYKHAGTIWAGRYRCAIVEHGRHLLDSYRYIDLNRDRDRDAHPRSADRWSSCARNVFGARDPLIEPHADYTALGITDAERQAAYREFCSQRMPENCAHSIRESTYKEWVLGSERFQAQITDKLHRQSAPLSRGGDRRSEAYKCQVPV